MNMQYCTAQAFASPYGFPQGQSATVSFGEPQYPIHHASYTGLQYMYGYPQRPHMMTDRAAMCDGKTESKPRLSKDEVEKLEKVFQENPKPSSSVKAQLADGLGLERPRINNWFQNRRAKAKQEKKQEEYEAQRAAEKSASEPSSPDEEFSSTEHNPKSEASLKRTQPSSAAFPNVSSPSQATNSVHEDDEDEEEEDDESEGGNDGTVDIKSSASPRVSFSDTIHSPLSADYAQSESTNFTQTHSSVGYLPSRSMSDYGMFTTPLAHDPTSGLPSRGERSLSSESYSSSQHYTTMPHGSMSGTSRTSVFFSPMSSSESCDMSESPYETTASPDCHSDPTSHVVSPGMPTPTDSFRSPPPPANIASRRKISGPAELDMNAATSRSRSYNLPKTAMDGPKRMGITSPVSSMRRISSATGTGPGRIQKPSAGPRSPMFFGRNAEALLQYHARSPVGSGTPTFPGAAPPTPMTPALFDQRNLQEPAVISASSDDGAFDLGVGVAHGYLPGLKEENDLKTPPTTPGMLTDYGTSGYVSNTYNSGFHINTDQPLMTPYFHSEFPDLSMQNVPNYVDSSDAVPPTPVYGGVMGSSFEHAPVTGNVMGNTQYDWDANESVISSRSSPSHPKSKQIQFTPNITPQDYH